MSTCRWCTLGGSDTTEFLKNYASKRLSREDLEGSNDDLCYCLECVVEYHKAREKLPKLHEVLWELETSRLVAHIEKSTQEDDGEDDELFIVDENGETQLPGYVGPDFENNLRVPLLEILKYPYLLLHEKVSELCVEVLCRMEQSHRSFQVFEKYPGIYLFLVHPNEVIRRWAILTARNLGKVDRDDYYDLQEVLTCLFKVNELGRFESPDIYSSSVIGKGKLIHLPSHLYDNTNYKNYWLGICMLLTVLEEQAMDSLLLGPDKQNDFMQSILDTMEKGGADDSTDPFWPALHCFMVILDQLGSKVWGQLIDPVQAFQTIINSVSYMNEIKNIRSRFQRTKPEPDSDDDDMVTCSQIVYNYNTEKPLKDTGWKTAICPDYCPSLYEDMQALANLLQSDIGRDMRVHNSAFMWFIPFVQSLTDLEGLGAAYIAEVIHYLCLETKNILNERIQQCDKISEFFLLILVSIIELHRNKKCLHLLWICSQEWVEAVVRCAKLPAAAFTPRTEKASGYCVRNSSASLQGSTSVQHACVQLIRSLLREGYQIGQNAVCKQYLDKLNHLLRGNLSLGRHLNVQETHELQLCLRQVIKSIRDKTLNPSVPVGNNADSSVLPTVLVKQEKSDYGYGRKMSVDGSDGLPSPLAVVSEEGEDDDYQESPFLRRKSAKEEEWRDAARSSRSWTSTGGLLLNIKQEVSDLTTPEYDYKQNSLATKLRVKVEENRNSDLVAGKCNMDNRGFNPNVQRSDGIGGTELENQCEVGPVTPGQLPPQTHIGSPERVHSSDAKESSMSSSSSSKFRVDALRLMELKNKVQKMEWFSRELWSPKPCDLKSSDFSKNDPGLQKNEDDILLLGISDTLAKRGSTEEKSNSLLKSVIKMETDMQTSDQEQANLNYLAQHDCKGQTSKTFCMDKTSANIRVPSTSENKKDVCNPPSQMRPLSIKRESSDRLVEFSEYFRRENNLVVKKEEDIAKRVSEDALTDSQVDRELSKLSLVAYAKSVNFSLDSSQESSVHHNVYDIKRKVKGAVRSSSDGLSTKSSCDASGHGREVIVISDSSDEENNVTNKKETKQLYENVCPEEQPSTSSCVSESKSPDSPSLLEDCESQYFEFETEDDVFSVWQDTQAYSTAATQEYKQECGSTSNNSSSSNELLKDHTNEWGYDVDYRSDETMEEAANIIEKRLENISNTKEVTSSTLQESVNKEEAKDPLENFTDGGAVAKDFILDSKSTEPRASSSNISLASKLALKKSSTSPRKNIAKSKVGKTIQRSPKKPSVLKTAQNKKLFQTTTKYSQPGRSVPVVVPPRKVRQCPAPESTVEKLGLKKAPRKAFELSQRSLDSIVQLRSHGKAAGRVCAPQKLKTKQIAAQSLTVKHNRKFLACQDRQYLRQTRPRKSSRGKNSAGSYESRNTNVSKMNANTWKQKLGSSELASVEGSISNQGEKKMEETVGPSTSERKFRSLSVEETRVSKMLCSSDSYRKSEVNNSVIIPPVPVDSSLLSATLVGNGKDEPSGRDCVVQPECEKMTTEENGCKPNADSEEDDDDDMFLTQSDPVDMDLCSQEDTAIAIVTPEEMDTAESLQQNDTSSAMKCKNTDCVEEVEKPGDYCRKHSATSSEADHLFVKPSLPPPKIRKPSTTKIFSSASSSRNAAFSKDLEVGNKLPLTSKSKVNAAKQVMPRPLRAKVVPAGNQTSLRSSNIPQPSGYDNVLRPQNRQNTDTSRVFRSSTWQTYSSFLGVQQRDHSIFVKEVLKWTHEMFATFSQFGSPSHLVHSVVASVPIQFQGYDDYFNTFFPLMMLNAFETLAQEWIENQRVKEKNYYLLHLKSFSADSNTAKFEAHFRETDLARQLYPKEDDLVFLVVQKRKDSFREESERENQTAYHVGLVTRFCRASGCSTRKKEQLAIYELYVQTQGNLSFFINNQVKCVVIGSLVTTHRTFKALLLLSRSPLAKTIINPSHSDFCPRDLPVSSETLSDVNKYNEDQQRAIETAYAMVKQHPVLPKVCLIHGPPGTGKSKTIVGLLSRVLRENTRNEKTARRSNSRMKPNRFLVCAPSNAAVDELMKKIIVAFKEKCQNRKEPLGNCGDIKLVRLGAEKAINSEVRGFSLDKQVEHRMKRKTTDFEQDLQKKKEAIDQRLDVLIRQRAMNKCEKRESQMINDEFNRLSKEREQIASQLKEVRGHSQKVQADIILESDIICCTLSTSGGGLLESTFSRQGLAPFSCVIVDEAGQSCEVETLIPLIHRCNKLVLVGDPRQLPPTVKSVKAQEYGYDQSLMARLHRHLEEQVRMKVLRSLPVVQLTVQYRMHPDICLFPSNYVYGRTLKTDKATEENRCSSEWPFQPYLIFDVGDGREERDNDSFSNPQEVKLVMELIRTIKEKRKDLGLRRIGIITPYSAQKKKIQEQLDKVFRNNSPGEVDTVDAFQGREKDCIIVTCVRANNTKGSIGFLASLQRLNVTITRARFSLFILGRLETLMENKDWNELIQDAHKRGAIIKTSEGSYRKDAARILKLKPAMCPSTKAGTKKSFQSEAASCSSKKGDVANPWEASSHAGPNHAVPPGVRGPQQPQGAQVAADTRRGSASAPVEAAALPANQEKPRDPRLASMASRSEAKGKEQTTKDSNQSAHCSPGSSISQQGLDMSSAARDQISRTETSKKPLQTMGQRSVLSTLPHSARHEGDSRDPAPRSILKAHSGGQSSSSNWNKDCQALTRTSENAESNSAKRRKTSH